MLLNYGVTRLQSTTHQVEDAFAMFTRRRKEVQTAARGEVCAVLDGVGGAPDGGRAARYAAEGLGRFFQDAAIPGNAQGIERLLQEINNEIRDWGLIPGTDRSLGAAAVTLAWFPSLSEENSTEFHLFHAGDTLAWRYREDGTTLIPLTSDHGTGKTLLNYLGIGTHLRLDTGLHTIEYGDLLLLATDGVLKGRSTTDKILGILRDEKPTPERPKRVSDRVAKMARANGSQDDITVLVVELVEPE